VPTSQCLLFPLQGRPYHHCRSLIHEISDFASCRLYADGIFFSFSDATSFSFTIDPDSAIWLRLLSPRIEVRKLEADLNIAGTTEKIPTVAEMRKQLRQFANQVDHAAGQGLGKAFTRARERPISLALVALGVGLLGGYLLKTASSAWFGTTR
jgi:hypothetical protein